MRFTATFLFLLTLLFSCQTNLEKETLLEQGISLSLAKYRKKQVSAAKYQLAFSIPRAKEKPIPAELTLTVTLADLKHDLILDFNEEISKIKAISVNGTSVEIRLENEHLILDAHALNMGENTIEILFDAGEQSLNRNDEFLYTLLVPDRASTLFPCFDQPDIKATYQLTITAPSDWEVVCGAYEESFETKGNYITHYFGETDPMSTYLFSFVAGKFKEVTQNPGAFDMRFLYRETDKEKIEESVAKVFDIHNKSLQFLEAYTAVKFPFQKMDFVTIPPFQYGGMEHVGAIQYRESSLFLDKNATENRRLRRAKLIAHETSHMWFGDLVTMRWFNDVWMKEVFANFMADKIMNPVFPTINHDLSFMMTHYPSAYAEDRTLGTNPIRQELGNLKNAGSLYGSIIYNKAPIMMRQLEQVLGEKAFQKGIQEYIKTYANDNADWNQLVAILDKNSTLDIKKWSEIWVNSSGRPIISDAIVYQQDTISSFKVYQEAEDGTAKIWAQTFDIGLIYADSVAVVNVSITGKETQIMELIGKAKPKAIVYNYNGFGYGVFPVHDVLEDYIDINNEVARGYAFMNSYENMLNGKLGVLETYTLFLRALAKEKNEQILSYLTGGLQTIFWTFLTPDQQEELQPILVKEIQYLLESNLPRSLNRILFNLYAAVGYSAEEVETLYQLWSKEKTINNLVLNENDFINIATKLALFEHPKAAEVLRLQELRIRNKDRKERFVWTLPSLSSDPTERAQFMQSLLQKENREKESWVQTALNNMHHPLRQKEAIKSLKACLAILEEVQLTGDIFFPKRWLASSIGNYSSQEAFLILEVFLKENPNFNASLKQKLLQTTDNLRRAQFINP